MSKRERVEATLNHQPVDRVALLEQLSHNPKVIADWTGKAIEGFNYTRDDVCDVIKKTMDMVMPPGAPNGTERITTEDGFVIQNDNWTRWRVSRPFTDEHGARNWLRQYTVRLKEQSQVFDAEKVRNEYRNFMHELQKKIGDTVILAFSGTGFCSAYEHMGLEIFTFFQIEYPEVLKEYLKVNIDLQLKYVPARADFQLSPVILIPEDFATKQGPTFSPAFLHEHLFPYVKKLTEAWHEHGIKVLYHSDGNYRKVIPDLMQCGVDGFYCLEPNCGMDIVELKNTWPQMVWAGGVDGVDLLERGTPVQVRAEVHRHIRATDALQTGGMFVASSSEINPPIKPENFKAMVDAVGEMRNPSYGHGNHNVSCQSDTNRNREN